MKCGDKEHESQKASESESMMNKKNHANITWVLALKISIIASEEWEIGNDLCNW